MSTYSSLPLAGPAAVPVRSLEYRDMHVPAQTDEAMAADETAVTEPVALPAEVQLSEAEFAEHIRSERIEAIQQTEARMRQDLDQKLATAQSQVAAALAAFSQQRADYFTQVEGEVVQLALAIAAKILHREAQVDPMLVASLVRMAVEKLREGASVTVRVGRGRAARWKEYFAAQTIAARVTVVEDPALTDQDCMLETELGVANFGLDTQLKEVEQGFFDLLALKPVSS